MTLEEVQIISSRVNGLAKINIEQRLGEIFNGNLVPHAKFSSILTIQQIASYHGKIVNEIKREIKSGTFPFYERYYPVNGNSIDLIAAIQNYATYLSNGNKSQIEINLIYIVQYCMIWGFWERSTRKTYPLDIINIQEYLSSVRLIMENLEKAERDYKSLHGKLVNEKGNITTFINEKEDDYVSRLDNIKKSFATLEENVKLAQTNFNQITQFATDSLLSYSKIDDIYHKSIEWEQNYKELEEKTKLLNISQTESVANIGAISADATSLMSSLEKDEKRIVELLGLATGNALYEKLNLRKSDIQSTIRNWLIAAGVSFLMLGGWIAFAWTQNILANDFTWQGIGGNILRVLPFTIPLYFTLRQYSKERIYLEEYAFKASIAVTLEAFRRLLSHDEAGQTALVASATKEIFTSPKGVRDSSMFRMRSRDVSSSIKEILDILKTLKS